MFQESKSSPDLAPLVSSFDDDGDEFTQVQREIVGLKRHLIPKGSKLHAHKVNGDLVYSSHMYVLVQEGNAKAWRKRVCRFDGRYLTWLKPKKCEFSDEKPLMTSTATGRYYPTTSFTPAPMIDSSVLATPVDQMELLLAKPGSLVPAKYFQLPLFTLDVKDIENLALLSRPRPEFPLQQFLGLDADPRTIIKNVLVIQTKTKNYFLRMKSATMFDSWLFTLINSMRFLACSPALDIVDTRASTNIKKLDEIHAEVEKDQGTCIEADMDEEESRNVFIDQLKNDDSEETKRQGFLAGSGTFKLLIEEMNKIGNSERDMTAETISAFASPTVEKHDGFRAPRFFNNQKMLVAPTYSGPVIGQLSERFPPQRAVDSDIYNADLVNEYANLKSDIDLNSQIETEDTGNPQRIVVDRKLSLNMNDSEEALVTTLAAHVDKALSLDTNRDASYIPGLSVTPTPTATTPPQADLLKTPSLLSAGSPIIESPSARKPSIIKIDSVIKRSLSQQGVLGYVRKKKNSSNESVNVEVIFDEDMAEIYYDLAKRLH